MYEFEFEFDHTLSDLTFLIQVKGEYDEKYENTSSRFEILRCTFDDDLSELFKYLSKDEYQKIQERVDAEVSDQIKELKEEMYD